MKEFSLADFIQCQALLEQDITNRDITVLIRARDRGVLPIESIEIDPVANESVIVAVPNTLYLPQISAAQEVNLNTIAYEIEDKRSDRA